MTGFKADYLTLEFGFAFDINIGIDFIALWLQVM